MCGRVNVSDHKGVQQLLDFLDIPQYPKQPAARFNIAPGSQLLTVGNFRQEKVRLMQWGLSPNRASDSHSRLMINARSETLWEKPSFKDLIMSQRVIVPVNAFYEWDRKVERKIPYAITHSENTVLALAGIYKSDNRGNFQCCLITTEANKSISKFHHRMPVILEKENLKSWLNSNDKDELNELLQPSSDNVIQIHRVSEYVNSASNEGAECMRESDGKEKFTPNKDETQSAFDF